MSAVLEVRAVDRVSQVPAPVARFVTLEVSPAVLRETLFGTKHFLVVVRFRGAERERFGRQRFVAPSARYLLYRRIYTVKNVFRLY